MHELAFHRFEPFSTLDDVVRGFQVRCMIRRNVREITRTLQDAWNVAGMAVACTHQAVAELESRLRQGRCDDRYLVLCHSASDCRGQLGQRGPPVGVYLHRVPVAQVVSHRLTDPPTAVRIHVEFAGRQIGETSLTTPSIQTGSRPLPETVLGPTRCNLFEQGTGMLLLLWSGVRPRQFADGTSGERGLVGGPLNFLLAGGVASCCSVAVEDGAAGLPVLRIQEDAIIGDLGEFVTYRSASDGLKVQREKATVGRKHPVVEVGVSPPGHSSR